MSNAFAFVGLVLLFVAGSLAERKKRPDEQRTLH
jgi:hypothetical protein